MYLKKKYKVFLYLIQSFNQNILSLSLQLVDFNI